MGENNKAYGTLYMVATPIGNWGDMTPRALEILGKVELIAAEDTRYAQRLLRQFDIKKQVISCRQENEKQKAGRIISELEQGKDVAFVSDAGTPGISDPGAALVEEVANAGFDVRPAPGAGAVEAALSVSGLCTGGYHFLGFLPRSKSKQAASLKSLSGSRLPIVLFESPRRIHELLENAREAIGNRRAALCRELTKVHEEIFRGTLEEISEAIQPEPLGEMVLVIAGATTEEAAAAAPGANPDEVLAEAKRLIAKGMSRSDAAKALVDEFGIRKKEAYGFTKSLDPDETGPEDDENAASDIQKTTVEITAHGHPDLRSKHDKTLEFKSGADLSPRETCVTAVGAKWDTVAVKKLSGRVRITIECEGARDELDADICRSFNSAERIVIRKSPKVSAVTLAVNATKSAAELDRVLVARLQAGGVARITIQEQEIDR